MGVYEDRGTMHWQQNERYISSYEAGSDLSPAAPAASPGSPRDCTSCRKREPPDDPPPPEDCAGCGSRITDRYYLLALERRWHTPCLRCCECKMPLDSEQRCYARDSNIFCKNDYFRLYGSKRCARCNTTISASELVMRARDLVFHVHCFSCALCSTHLNKGDTFGIRDSAVYCRLHYETMPEYGPHMAVPGPPQLCPGPYVPPGPHYPPYPSPEFARGEADVAKGFFNGTAAPPPRQKGRPRKKKPKDQDIMSANLDLNPEYLEMGFRGGGSLGSSSRTKRMRTSFKHHQLRTMKSYFAINHNPDAKDLKQLSQKTGLPKRVLQYLSDPDLNPEYLEMGFRGGGSLGSSSRTKRMRTSFKHHQLRTMKSYFAINHNPDAKDLKQLSQKTGLPKRVLQVWFQNARAKWRRMVTKQENKMADKCSPDASLEMDMYHGPMGSIQSLPPHSPPYSVMGGPPSPNSMDCP
ncbi:LIM/homeobox protein Lhx9-like [Choristoneura fumiferana]|uniref:LIM/homeobox protein Lhx9-like n=1 Tax=Choristoneura fumiferana TaxID=7141 RepID=UPI003D157EBC